MGRRDYLADLDRIAANPRLYGVLKVTSGSDSEALVEVDCPHGPVTIAAFIDEPSSYPASHNFTLMISDDSTPDEVSHAIAKLQMELENGTSISSLCKSLSYCLSVDADGDTEMPDSQIGSYDDDEEEDSGSESSMEDDVFDFGDERPRILKDTPESASYDNVIPLDARNKLRRDLLLIKEAGFKVGVSGPLIQGHPAYLATSCLVSRLGISEEAMQAWRLLPNEYLILLIQYPKGYWGVGHIDEVTSAKSDLDFRFGVSSYYKPSHAEIIEAFNTLSPDPQIGTGDQKTTSFRKLFISGPLQDLFSEKFITLLKCRLKGMSWDGAMAYWHDHQGISQKEVLAQDPKYRENEDKSGAYPPIVSSDHITTLRPGDQLSLPLIAMQLYVRQVVRCTEFCLVCHRKMPTDIQAIKPYVCDRQLCLYQYMQLGFGPSIEHEIITQPQVVDLLISLCYVSATQHRLKSRHLPKGLALRVPRLDVLKLNVITDIVDRGPATAKKFSLLPPQVAKPAKANLKMRELLFDKGVTRYDTGLRQGDWILLNVQGFQDFLHCRIEDTAMFPVVKLSPPIALPMDGKPSNINIENALSGYQDANFVPYSEDLDNFEEHGIRDTVAIFLDLLPSVSEMREYLLRRGAQASLHKWTRITAPSLGLLRWIIASNRACIMQIGGSGDDINIQPGTTREDTVWGMPGYTQFRIAMGAPDKERRFLNSVRKIAEEMKLKIPTIFAWHGSGLGNWHSILREGLNFEETLHGRAFGHGVYFSKDLRTSLGYSSTYSQYPSPRGVWRSSELAVSNAISLNEIVNAPSRFVSSTPHYVVDKIDWIQSRYLFIQTSAMLPVADRAPSVPPGIGMPLNPIDQDPRHIPWNDRHEPIVIPATASRSRLKAEKATTTNAGYAVYSELKRVKAGNSGSDPIDLDEDDGESVATEDEDRKVLETELENKRPEPFTKTLNRRLPDFEPGTLDYETLEILPRPENAMSSMIASKRLGAELKSITKTQSTQPLHDLGWYIDTDKMENMYQWIFELHTFDPSLPLAQDMKAKGIKSVVLEMIFGPDYPFSPPFVRVIRPRFLPFLQGGGGHVTAGGALCMELLTNDGWSSASAIEAVLMQVRLAMSSIEPRPARLDSHQKGDYGIGEAVDAYIRACQVHGWTVPHGFKQMIFAGRNTAPRQF